MKKVYFDNASTSFPKAPHLSDTISDFVQNRCVNINRGIYGLSSVVSDVVLDTRIRLCRMFDCSDDPVKFCKRIIFTSGVTQSINTFLRGILSKGDHVVTGSMEHHAVMRTLTDMRDNYGVEFDVVPCDERGVVTAHAVEQFIRPDTKAVIINHASNIFGTVSPIEEIGRVCAQHGVFFAVDTAQTAGVLDISMRRCNIDFLAFSGHKGLLSLQGIGGFAMSQRLSEVLRPLVTGGTGSLSHLTTQPDILPDKFESGTLNLCGIYALNHSLRFIESIGICTICSKELMLRRYFIDKFSQLCGVTLYCTDESVDCVAVVSVSFDNADNAFVASVLESDYGIMTRCGLHCAPSAHHSLNTYPDGTVRFSFSYFNTTQEIDYCVQAIKEILKGE